MQFFKTPKQMIERNLNTALHRYRYSQTLRPGAFLKVILNSKAQQFGDFKSFSH